MSDGRSNQEGNLCLRGRASASAIGHRGRAARSVNHHTQSRRSGQSQASMDKTEFEGRQEAGALGGEFTIVLFMCLYKLRGRSAYLTAFP